MKYFDIPVNICVEAETEEEAQMIAYMFMPWTSNSGKDWSLAGHEHLREHVIDNWVLLGVDSDEMEGRLRDKLWR